MRWEGVLLPENAITSEKVGVMQVNQLFYVETMSIFEGIFFRILQGDVIKKFCKSALMTINLIGFF